MGDAEGVVRQPAGLWLPVAFVIGFGCLAVAGFMVRATGVECTLRGCQPTVTFDLASQPTSIRDATVAATICVDGSCATQPVGAGQPLLRGDLLGTAAGSASVVLVGAGGDEVARYESTEAFVAEVRFPNGPDCGPPCPLLRLTERNGVLTLAG